MARSLSDIYEPPTYPAPSTTNTNTGTPVSMPPLGGPLPPTPVQTVTMPPLGGPLPPVPVSGTPINMPPTGGPNQPVPVSGTPVNMPPTGGPNQPVPLPQPAGPAPGNFGPAQTVDQMVEALMNGQYGTNAAKRGAEMAGARGLANSSIAAGASRRAALEAIQPFVSEGMDLLNNRENRAFQGQESALEREFRRQLQNDSVLQENWLRTNQFNNEFNAQLSMLPVTNSLQMLQLIMQAGLNDPEVFTPSVMSGLGNFFNNNMLTLLKQYFPQNFQSGTNTNGGA